MFTIIDSQTDTSGYVFFGRAKPGVALSFSEYMMEKGIVAVVVHVRREWLSLLERKKEGGGRRRLVEAWRDRAISDIISNYLRTYGNPYFGLS